MQLTITCAHLLYPATLIDPAEFCDEDALPDTEYCARHREIDWDDYADWQRDQLEDR